MQALIAELEHSKHKPFLHKRKKELGATNAVISVLAITLFLIVVLTIHYLMIYDNSELASEELHNGTQIALSDAILTNQTEGEFGRQYIIETIGTSGSQTAPASAKTKVASTFNSALTRNFNLDGNLRPKNGALYNMSENKKVQVLEFFVLERQDSINVNANSFRVYTYNCSNGTVGSCSAPGNNVSTITGSAAKPYIKKITGSETRYPAGSTIYARVAFAAGTDDGIRNTLLTNGTAKDPGDGKGQLVEFDNQTSGNSPVNGKNANSYHVGASVSRNLPAVAVTEIMDITTQQNDAR